MNDLRLAIKSLRHSPVFTVIAIVTLGLGIGANTAMFSILNGYTLRPAPYPDRDRLDRIYRATPPMPRGAFSSADYVDLKAEMGQYGEIAAYADWNVSLSEPGKTAEMAEALRVSANLFTTLGARMELGRTFRPDEETAGNHRVLVISHRYWKNRFGGDPRVIGKIVRVDGDPYEIVGVLPVDFSDWRHLDSNDVYRPLGLDEKEIADRNSPWLRLVGRRAETVTRDRGAAFLADFGRRLATDFPAANADTTWRTIPIDESFLASTGPNLIGMLIGLSGFVLLIACSNLANLLLARTMARAREFAVRSALGASPPQMLRPLLVESVVLAIAGGVFALFVAMWTFDWLAVISAGDNGIGVNFTFDWRVLSWALAACLFTAVAFGVAPALFALRLDLAGTLKSGGRGSTASRGHRRFRDVLIVGQLALAMMLLAGATLFMRGLHEISNRRHGWQSDNLVTGTMVLPSTTYPGDQRVADFQHLALERLAALPGVESASISYAMPFFGLAEPRRYLVSGHAETQAGHEPLAVVNGVSPRYFDTVSTRLLSGRAFNDGDTADAPRVFVINEAMAQGLFPGESPLGRRLAQAGGKTIEWGEIIGVAGDVESVYPNRAILTGYQIYQPMAQEPRRLYDLAVRTRGASPAALINTIRSTMTSLDPDLPVRKLQPAAVTIARANYQEGVFGKVLSALALLGLGLASLGVYGVIARTVAQRTSEFGIRLALGAQARDITRLVLTSGAKLALVGTGLGLGGAFLITRLLSSAFPRMHPETAPVLIGATMLLIAIAQLAGYIPARSASRISPTEALRAE